MRLPHEDPVLAVSIRVRGLVQGVGFRPTVATLARELGLAGKVLNDGDGVLIYVEGAGAERLVPRLLEAPPPLARIDDVEIRPVNPRGSSRFEIASSRHARAASTGVVADAATCSECRDETLQVHERRYRYPFTNCTHCGPRFSIIEGIPYDRPQTTMRAFEMCADCAAEYEDDNDRRYHAQPIACPVCGPRVWLERADGERVAADRASDLDELDAVAALFEQGEIVAIRGVGGYHLACDATNASAVERLRERKARESKPLALMARDRGVIERYARVSDVEWQALSAPAAPIVLLDELGPPPGQAPLADAIAPDTHLLGFMIPYTPLHGLIMKRMDVPVVMTSGNRSDEPQCTAVDEARDRLGDIADYFLHHDRDIAHRVDDSVVRVQSDTFTVLRHARGLAPGSLPAVNGGRSGLAMGGDLKSAIALSRGRDLVLSQHLGDLDEPATRDEFERAVDLYLALFETNPEFVAVDTHPGYVSRALGERLSERLDVPMIEVQHHHAHVAACLAEHRREDRVVGVVLDGIGWGSDGTAWGGEVLIADLDQFERVGALTPRALLGGDRAAKEPWRNAYSNLVEALGWEELESFSELRCVQDLLNRPRPTLDAMMASEKTVRSSSAGRLFDAVAAVLGVHRERIGHEAQAAMALEALAEQSMNTGAYTFDFVSEVPLHLNSTPMWRALLRDLGEGVSVSVIARRFHLGLAEGFALLAAQSASARGLDTVVLSGGCFANTLLTRELTRRLESNGLEVLTHRRIPPGDGGLAAGQAAIARRREETCV